MNDWRRLTHLTDIVVLVHGRHITTRDTVNSPIKHIDLRERICYRFCRHPAFHKNKCRYNFTKKTFIRRNSITLLFKMT